MQTQLMTVTPDLAKAWLTNQHTNRPLNRNHVDALKREIIAGNWTVTHQGIALDRMGKLVDGQHRCAAIVAADTPVAMLVTFGLEYEDALRAVDQGKIRLRGQLFAMKGETQAGHKAAICRALNILITPDLTYTASLGPADEERTLNRFRPSILQAIEGGRALAGVCAPLALLFDRNSPIAEGFRSGYYTGASLEIGDPRLLLREQINNKSTRRGGSSIAEHMLRTISAIDAFAHNERFSKLHISSSRYERFCLDMGIPINKSLAALSEGRRPGAKSK